MKQKVLVLFFFFLLSDSMMHAQKENNNWAFGYRAGMTWNVTQTINDAIGINTPNASLTGMPTPFESEMGTGEGCFSISDANGNLLFYSDGITIYDKEHIAMPNANGDLTGDPSSAQSGIVVPYPGQPNRYIAFTLGERNQNNLSYSIVDMSLKGNGTDAAPLGDVTEEKNVRLTGMGILGESLTAVRHSNKKDVWVIAIGRGITTHFNVWKVTEEGVNHTLHQTYEITDANTLSTINQPSGYLIFNNEGNKYAWAGYGYTYLTFGRFNPATGQFESNKRRLVRTPGSLYGECYGIAFVDPYIYMTYISGDFFVNAASGLDIYNFDDLEANPGDATNPLYTYGIPVSYVDGTNGHMGAIALGSDKRLYVVNSYSPNLYVIENPETLASMKLYNLPNFFKDESGNPTGGGLFGISTFMAPMFRVNFAPIKQACMNKPSDYILNIYGGEGFEDMESIILDWGDGTSTKVSSPEAGSYTYSHTYAKRGNYTIKATPYSDAAATNPIPELIYTSVVKVHSCSLPVNHNISVMGYD